jgi:hypothetical protein
MLQPVSQEMGGMSCPMQGPAPLPLLQFFLALSVDVGARTHRARKKLLKKDCMVFWFVRNFSA